MQGHKFVNVCIAKMLLQKHASHKMQRMMHLIFFRAHIAQVVGVGLHLDGDILHDGYSITLQSYALDGVVGHQAQALGVHGTQYLCTYAVVALVGIEAQVDICLHGVFALLLQLVSADLVHQSDAATFLIEVYQYAFAFLLDAPHSFVQLFAAFAAFAAEDVTGHAG